MQSLFHNIVSLNPLKKLIASTIQAQLSKYIEDIQLEELGLLGGNIVLENLELRKDVIQELMGIPLTFDLSRGFIKELRISIPWTRLTTKPIEIKFHTIEIIVVPTHNSSRKRSTSSAGAAKDGSPQKANKSGSNEYMDTDEDVKSQPSWIQSLITRVIANISINIENIVFKYDDGSVVASAYLRSFSCHSADPDLCWEQKWLEPLGPYQMCHKLIQAKQLTICLDKYGEQAGSPTRGIKHVEGFERPLLDRMSLTIRLQVPLEKRPDFDQIESIDGGQSKAELDLQATEQLFAYGTGDISFDPFDSTWANSDQTSSDTRVYPVYSLPFPSNCTNAIQGKLRRPQIHTCPFDDIDGSWEPMEGWISPSINELDPAGAECMWNDNSPVPALAMDIYCSSVNMSLSARHIMMIHHLQSLFESEDGVIKNLSSEMINDVDVEQCGYEEHVEEPTSVQLDESPGWFGGWFGSQAPVVDVSNHEDGEKVTMKPLNPVPKEEFPEFNFMVVSFHVAQVKFELLRHEASELTTGRMTSPVESIDGIDSSMSVPVFGLGEVQISGLHIENRGSKVAEKAPKPFMLFEFADLTLDTQVLSGASIDFKDIKIQLCSFTISPADELYEKKSPRASFSMGEVSLKPSLVRTAEVHLDNYSLLRCTTPMTANASNETIYSQAWDAARAFDMRIVNLAKTNMDKGGEQSSTGTSIDVCFGTVNLKWDSNIMMWIHVFMCESNILRPSESIGIKSTFNDAAPDKHVQDARKPSYVVYSKCTCKGLKAEYSPVVGPLSSTLFEFGNATFRYELTNKQLVGNDMCRGVETIEMNLRTISVSSMRMGTTSHLLEALQCQVNMRMEKNITPIKACVVSCEASAFFGHLEIMIDPLGDYLLGSYVRAVFDMMSLLSLAKKPSGSVAHHSGYQSSERHQFSLVNGECDFSLNQDASLPMVVSASLESFEVGSKRFPVVFTTQVPATQGTDDDTKFLSFSAALKYATPDMIGYVEELFGLSISSAAHNSLPQVELEISLKHFEVIASCMEQAISDLLRFTTSFASIAFPSGASPRNTVKTRRIQARDCIVSPKVLLESSTVWLSPQLQLFTPKVESSKLNTPTSLKFIDSEVTLSRLLLVITEQPYQFMGSSPVPPTKDPSIIFELPICIIRSALSHSSIDDAISISTRCSMMFDLDSTKMALLSHFLRTKQKKATSDPLEQSSGKLDSSTTPCRSINVDVLIDSVSASVFTGNLSTVAVTNVDTPSQYIQFACDGVEVTSLSSVTEYKTSYRRHVKSYRFAIRSLGNCVDLWYPPCSSLAFLLEGVLSGQMDSPRLRYWRGQSCAILLFIDAVDLISLKVAIGPCRKHSTHTQRPTSPHSNSWPWLCTESTKTNSVWFEVQGNSEDIPGEKELKRPEILVKLKKSDVVFHLPTISTVASVLLTAYPSSTPVTSEEGLSARKDMGALFCLPHVTLEVQPLRVLLPYRRQVRLGSCCVDALQWTFTISAATATEDNSKIRGVVGPMDVATVTWQRRLIQTKYGASSPSKEGSLVLQGPTAQFFAALGTCYVMNDEQLFGNPFQFNISLADTITNASPSKIETVVDASLVVISCQPSQYAAAMSLIDMCTASLLHVSSAYRSTTPDRMVETANQSSLTSLHFIFKASFPGIQVLVEDINSNPLVQLKMSKVSISGSSPGAALLRIQECDLLYWPPECSIRVSERRPLSPRAFEDDSVSLFGLGMPVNDILKQPEDPLFSLKWMTLPNSHEVADIVAELLPVVFYATPSILDALLGMTSNAEGKPKDTCPLLLMKSGAPNLLPFERSQQSFFGNVSIKVLTRQVQFILANGYETGPAMLVNAQHIFISKSKQSCPEHNKQESSASMTADSIQDIDKESHSFRNNKETLSTTYDYNTRLKAEDDIMLNLVGFSVTFLNAFQRSQADTCLKIKETNIYPFETVKYDECSLKPSTVTVSIRGRAVNDQHAMAYLDLVVDSDEIDMSFSVPQLQVMFAVVDKFSCVGMSTMVTGSHPSFVPPPTSSIASTRMQSMLPLDSMSRRFCYADLSKHSSIPSNTFMFGGNKHTFDSKTQAEDDHAKYLWVAPIDYPSNVASGGLARHYSVCSLARRECLSTKEWHVGASWRYSTPRSVNRLELKQMAAPHHLIQLLNQESDNFKEGKRLSSVVVHLRLERQDGPSGLWLAVACFSVPIDAINAPVTHQFGPASNLSLEASSWESWYSARYEGWCNGNRSRSCDKYLIPPSQSSIAWRLLWASKDISNGLGEVDVANKIFPALLFHSLEVASVEDLPFTSLRWSVRCMKVDVPSKHTSVLTNRTEQTVNICDNPPLASLLMESIAFNIELPSSAWMALQAPSVFMRAKMEIHFTDFSTLTTASFMKATPFVWCRGIPRGASYFATSAISMGLGDNASIFVTPRLFHTLKLFLFEISHMWDTPKVIPPKLSVLKDDCNELRYVIENLSNEPLWYGQQATAESMYIKVGERQGYSWRAIPSVMSDDTCVGLSLRFALSSVNSHSSSPDAWSEPVRIDDHELPAMTTRSVSVNVIRDKGENTINIPLIVSIRREALRVVVSLRGRYSFRSSLSCPIHMRWRVVSSLVAAKLSNLVNYHSISHRESFAALHRIGQLLPETYFETTVPAGSTKLFILAPEESTPKHDMEMYRSVDVVDGITSVIEEETCLMLQSKRSSEHDWSPPVFVSCRTGNVLVDSFSRTHCVNSANISTSELDMVSEPTKAPIKAQQDLHSLRMNEVQSRLQHRKVAVSKQEGIGESIFFTVKQLLWHKEGIASSHLESNHWLLVDIFPPVALHNTHEEPIVVTLEVNDVSRHAEVGLLNTEEERLQSHNPTAVECARDRLAAKMSNVGKAPVTPEKIILKMDSEPHAATLMVFRIPPGGQIAPMLEPTCSYTAKVYSHRIVGSLGLSGRAPPAAFAVMRTIAQPFHVDIASFLMRTLTTEEVNVMQKPYVQGQPLASIVLVSSSTVSDTQAEYVINGLLPCRKEAGLDCYIGPRILLKNHFHMPLFVRVLSSNKKAESVKTDSSGYPIDPSIVLIPAGESKPLPTELSQPHTNRPKASNSKNVVFLQYGTVLSVLASGEIQFPKSRAGLEEVILGWSQVHEVDLSDWDTSAGRSLATRHAVGTNELILPFVVKLSTSDRLEDISEVTKGPVPLAHFDAQRHRAGQPLKPSEKSVVSADGRSVYVHIAPRMVILNPTDQIMRCVLHSDNSAMSKLWLELPPVNDKITRCYLLALSTQDDSALQNAVMEGRIASNASPLIGQSEGKLNFLFGNFQCAGGIEERKVREKELASQEMRLKIFGTSTRFKFSMEFVKEFTAFTHNSRDQPFEVSPLASNNPVVDTVRVLPESLHITATHSNEAEEYRIVSMLTQEINCCFHLQTKLYTQPSMLVKNFLPLEEYKPYIEFKVDDYAPFPYRLKPDGGSAEYMFDTPIEPKSFWKSSPSMFRPSQLPKHKLRFRRCAKGGCSQPIHIDEAECDAWSDSFWIAEGVQMVSIGDVSAMVHVFYRAGTMVVCVFHPNSDGVGCGLDSLLRYAYRPYHFDVSLILTSCTINLLDDKTPRSFNQETRNQNGFTEHLSGIVLKEFLKCRFEGVMMRMQEIVPEPRTVRVKDGVCYVPEERDAHIKYLHKYTLVIDDAQIDSALHDCDLKTLLCFAEFPHSSSEVDISQRLPCIAMTLEMVAVHKRGSLPSSSFVKPKRQADIVLPYVKRLKVYFHRKVYLAAEENLLSRCTMFAQRCNECESKSTNDVKNMDAVDKWCKEVSSPLIFIEEVTISAMKLSVTLRIVVPGSTLFLGLDKSPFYFRSLDMKRVFASSSHLSSEVAASYAVDALLRSPALLGSLQLLGSPTAFVATIAVGARDLVVLPLEALPHGPLATSQACLQGWSSFFRSLSGGALSSVSGFSSSVSRNLSSLQTAVNSANEKRPHFTSRKPSFDVEGSFDSFRESDSDLEANEPESDHRVKRILGGIGRGLLGVVSAPLAPIVGAIGLVGRTTATLSSAVGIKGGFDMYKCQSNQVVRVLEHGQAEPFYCYHASDLWYQLKLMPQAAKLLLKASVLIDYDNTKEKSMVLVLTRSMLYVFRKESLWAGIDLSYLEVTELSRKTFIHVSNTSPGKFKGKGFSVHGLSTKQRAVLSDAVENHRLMDKGPSASSPT